MTLLICGIISLSLVILTVIVAVMMRKDLRKAVRALSVGFFMVILVALAPCHVDESGYSFGVNLFDTICVMITQSSLTSSLEAISQYQSPLVEAYRIYLICLYVLGPLTIASATLSFVKGFGRIVYTVKSTFTDSYIFSSANERSLAVCKSIRIKHPEAVVLFALDAGIDDLDERVRSQIDELGAIAVRQNVKDIKHSLRHKRCYFLLNNDSASNIELGLTLNDKYQNNKAASSHVELLIYSTDEMSQIIFYNTLHHVTIQLFREEEIIANDLIFNYPLYSGIVDDKLNILIVGSGKIGYEILKKVIWSGYFGDRVRTQISVVDIKATDAESKLKKECPALFTDCKLNLKFYNADIDNDSFANTLGKIDTPTYVVVALGDQKVNVKTCIYLRRYLGITNGFPKLHMTTDTEDYADKLHLVKVYDWKVNENRSFSNRIETVQDFEIKGFGSYESAYRHINPIDSSLGMLALACHAAKLNLPTNELGGYRKPNETIDQFVDSLTYSYNQILFTKNNADQLALSIGYILYMLNYPSKCADYLEQIRDKLSLSSIYEVPFALYIDPNYDFASELQSNLDNLVDIITERYNRFMYTLGWTNLPIEEIKNKSTRDQLRLRYARIGNYDIDALEKLINEGEEQQKNYRKSDTDDILRIPSILKAYIEIAREA